MISMDEERSQVTKMLSGLTKVLTIMRAQAKKRPQENIQEEMSPKNSWEEQRQKTDQAQGIIEKQQKKKGKLILQRLEHTYTGPEMPEEPSQRLEHTYTGPAMPGEPSQRLEHTYTGPEMPEEPSQRLEHTYTGPQMPGEPSQRLEHTYIGPEMPGEPSQRLEHTYTGPEMPGEPSQTLEHTYTGSEVPGELSRKRLDHECMEPRKPEKYRSGQDRPGKRSKQNSQSQVRRCPPNVKRSSKGNLKYMNELAIEALMDHKMPLRSILDPCP